ASQLGQRGGSVGRSGGAGPSVAAPRLSDAGSDNANTASSTSDTITDSVVSCRPAGRWTYAARLGTTSADVATTSSAQVVRARPEWNSCGPLRSPPTRNARPSTSRALPSTEPMTAACTTATRPAL